MMRDPKRDALMQRLAAEAQRESWSDENLWFAYYTQVSEGVGKGDALDQIDLLKLTFFDAIAIGRNFHR